MKELLLVYIIIILVLNTYLTDNLPLRLNLQTLSITGGVVRVEIFPPDANCHHLLAEVYSNGLEYPASHNFTTNSTEVLQIPAQLVGNYVKITARVQNGSLCVVDRSMNTFYHFPSQIHILSTSSAGGDVMISLSTAQCANPSIQWPANLNTNGKNCYCSYYINPNYSFSNCVESCMTDYQLSFSVEKSAVIFHNLSNTEDFLVHLLCESTNDSYFFFKWSSYKIRVENDSSTTVVPQELSPLRLYYIIIIVLIPAVILLTIFIIILFCRHKFKSYKNYHT